MKYRHTILHVDDDPEITRLVAKRLEGHGYELTSLNDPRLALAELARSQQRLVLLDIDMPHITGLDLLRSIHTDFGGTQVIMLTGLVTMQSVLQSFRYGAEFCIFKPITDMAPLLEAIERTFWKIDQWWIALEHLSQEKREGELRTRKLSESKDLKMNASMTESGS